MLPYLFLGVKLLYHRYMKKLKAYCTYCPSDYGEKERIFEYNKDTTFLVCPNCGKQLNPIEAHHAYLSFIRKSIHKADNYLDFYGKYAKAYQQYAYVISIEGESVEARLGRILSLAYLSTLRKAYFLDCLTLLNSEKESYTYTQQDLLSFLYFAKNMRFMAKTYSAQIKKRLTTYRYFYDIDCVKLYFQRLYELKELLNGILDELGTLKEEIQNNEVLNKSYTSSTHGITTFSRLLTADANVLDGSVYNFDGIDKSGHAVLKLKKKYALNHMFNYRHLYLISDNNRHLIKDSVFQFSNPLLTSLKIWSFLLLLSIIAFVLFGIASASSLAISIEWLRYFFLILSGTALVGFLISSIVVFSLRRKIKKIKRGTSK